MTMSLVNGYCAQRILRVTAFLMVACLCCARQKSQESPSSDRLSPGSYLLYVVRQETQQRLIARNMQTSSTFPIYTSEANAEIDFCLSPDAHHMAVIEWNMSRPAWQHFYWAQVSVIDLPRTTPRVLVGPQQYPAIPVWIGNDRVGLLLDGTRSGVFHAGTGTLEQEYAMKGYRPSEGFVPREDDSLVHLYAASLGLDSQVSKLKKKAEKVAVLAHNAEAPPHGSKQKTSSTGIPSGIREANLLRQSGFVQFPQDWIYDFHRGRVMAATTAFSVSPSGSFAAWSEHATEGGSIQVVNLASGKVVAKVIGLFGQDFAWNQAEDTLVYTDYSVSREGNIRTLLWRNPGSRVVANGEYGRWLQVQ